MHLRACPVVIGSALALMMATAVVAQEPPPNPPPEEQAGEQAPPDPESGTPRTRERTARPVRPRLRPELNPRRDPFLQPRVSRVPGPTQTQLSMWASVMGGYDDNLTVGLGTGAGYPAAAMPSGGTGYAETSLGYTKFNSHRSLTVSAHGALESYPGHLEGPAAGGSLAVTGMTQASRDWTLTASGRAAYQPVFNVLLQGSSAGPQAVGVETIGRAAGLYDWRSFSTNTSVSAARRLTRDASALLSYSIRTETFLDDAEVSGFGDARDHQVQAEYRHRVAHGVRLRAQYSFVDRQYTGAAGTQLPTTRHRLEVGPDIDQALSRRMRLTVSLATGATHLGSEDAAGIVRIREWVPTASLRTTLDVSPVASVEGGYTRDFQELRSVTDDIYTTDTAYLTAGGLVSPRVELRLGGTYSNWKASWLPGAEETMDVYGGSVRLRVEVSRKVRATAEYFYYRHTYSNPAALPTGFPAKYDRNSVRIGLSVWLPLKGATARPVDSAR